LQGEGCYSPKNIQNTAAGFGRFLLEGALSELQFAISIFSLFGGLYDHVLSGLFTLYIAPRQAAAGGSVASQHAGVCSFCGAFSEVCASYFSLFSHRTTGAALHQLSSVTVSEMRLAAAGLGQRSAYFVLVSTGAAKGSSIFIFLRRKK
jgi:hypothetical protein